MNAILFVLIASLYAIAQQQAQQSGARIEGIVVKAGKVATTDQSGRFAIRGLVPGDYKILAWEDVEPNAYFDPLFMEHYESQGQPIQSTLTRTARSRPVSRRFQPLDQVMRPEDIEELMDVHSRVQAEECILNEQSDDE